MLQDESFNGKSYYVVQIEPDLKKIAEMALKNQNAELSEDMDFEDMIKSYSSTIWVNKKTYVIEKSTVDMEMVITPENTGVEDAKPLTMKSYVEMVLSNFDGEANIVLPEGASEALSLEDLQAQMSQEPTVVDSTGMDSVTGNFINI